MESAKGGSSSIKINFKTTGKARPVELAFSNDNDETVPVEEKVKGIGKVIGKEKEKTPLEDNTEIDSLDDEPWLQAGLLVEVINGQVGEGRYLHKLGIVRRLLDGNPYGGEVHMVAHAQQSSDCDSTSSSSSCDVVGDVLRVDQDDLQTVVPKMGDRGLVIRGEEKGSIVVIESRRPPNSASRDVRVLLEAGPRRGQRLMVPASHICTHISIK